MMVVRSAGPHDVEALSQLIYMADTGSNGVSGWDLIYGGSSERVMEKIKWVYMNGHRTGFHHSKFILGEEEGQVLGAMAILSRDDSRILGWWKTFREMGESAFRIAVIAWRLLPFLLVNPSIPKDSLAVESAAVFPEHRGNAIAAVGLGKTYERAVAEGYRRIQIAIVIGNDAPRRACEKVGFKVEKEYRSRLFEKKFGAPGMMRMVLELPEV